MSDIPEIPKVEAPTKCKVCYRDIPEGEPDQYNASMYYQKPFTCSTTCYNKDWIRSQPVGAGWMPLVWQTYNKLNKILPGWQVAQIKEKFGGLRFYVSFPDDALDVSVLYDEAYAVIGEAEDASYKTCETCGEPGSLDDSSYWIATLCDDCKEKRAKSRKDKERE